MEEEREKGGREREGWREGKKEGEKEVFVCEFV